jgi:hypothetical protein
MGYILIVISRASIHSGLTRDTNEEFPDTVEDWDTSFVQLFDEFLNRVFRRFLALFFSFI